MRKSFRDKRKIERTNDFSLLFYDLNFSKNSLFCCNGYSNAIFTIISFMNLKENIKEKSKERKESANDCFDCCFIPFL